MQYLKDFTNKRRNHFLVKTIILVIIFYSSVIIKLLVVDQELNYLLFCFLVLIPFLLQYTITRIYIDNYENLIVTKGFGFLKYSTIPPAKIYFNLPLDLKKRQDYNVKRRKAIIASNERIKYLIRIFEELKTLD